MDKRTVIISKTNEDHTAYVMNYGINEISLFKELKDNGLELKNKEELSDGEILMLLRHCCKDGFVESVISIENHYNRDQKQINIYKENIEQKLKSQGCKIINHCDWKPSFNYDIDVINTRNYLTILVENIKDKEIKITNVDKELNELENEKQSLSEKIKKQNWYIENTRIEVKNLKEDYNQWNEKVDKLIERYNKGKEICENQENEAKEKWPEELKNLEAKINECKSNLLLLEKIYNEKTDNIKKLNIELNELEDEKTNTQKYIKNLNENGKSILEKIIKEILNNGILTKNEIKEKFLTTYKMYIMNSRKLPDFEIEYFKKQGLSDVDIQELIKIFN